MTAPNPESRDPRRKPDPGRPSSEPPKRDIYLSDADAVPDTPHAVEHGAEPGGERRASVRGGQAKGGLGSFVWILLAIVAIAIIFLLVGGGL